MTILETNRRRTPITLETKRVSSEVLSAGEYLELVKNDRASIKSSRVIMPTAGKRGFGSFLVTYTTPRFKAS